MAKLVLKITVVVVVALGVSIGLWFYLNGYLTKSKASEAIAKIAFTETKKTAKVGDIIQVGLMVTTETGMSGVDIVFETVGDNLNFLYPQSTSKVPVGFDEQLLSEDMMATQSAYGIKTLRRMIFIANKADAQLPKSIFIPLHFAVVSNGIFPTKSMLSVNIISSQVSGPDIPGNLFTLQVDQTPFEFTLEIENELQTTNTSPTPTSSVMASDSADLIFRLNFPDADISVVQLPNVKVAVLGDGWDMVCLDDMNCTQIVTFTRMGTSSYFTSPQLHYILRDNKPYVIAVKHPRTLGRTFKQVFLGGQRVLTCLGNNIQSECGQLINEIDNRPLFSGDMQSFGANAEGYNSIDIADLTQVGDIIDSQKASQTKSIEGDMNFDGSTDDKDYRIVGRNLGKKGD